MEIDVIEINCEVARIEAVRSLSLPIASLRLRYVKLSLCLIKHHAMKQGTGYIALCILNPSILEEVNCLIFTWTNVR